MNFVFLLYSFQMIAQQQERDRCYCNHPAMRPSCLCECLDVIKGSDQISITNITSHYSQHSVFEGVLVCFILALSLCNGKLTKIGHMRNIWQTAVRVYAATQQKKPLGLQALIPLIICVYSLPQQPEHLRAKICHDCLGDCDVGSESTRCTVTVCRDRDSWGISATQKPCRGCVRVASTRCNSEWTESVPRCDNVPHENLENIR